MARNIHKRITWKKEAVAQAAAVKRPRPAIRVIHREDDLVFVPGQLFKLAVPMEMVPPDPRWQPPPVPYIMESWYVQPPAGAACYIPKGSLAIFVGHTRVEEMEGTNVRSLLRATFFVSSGKYLATNLNHFEPLF